MFLGFVAIGDTLHAGVQARDGDLPADADALPAFRVYGQGGLLPSAGGQGAFLDGGLVTGASNANPIVITSAGHNLTTGMRVKISSVGGNLAANGVWAVTRIDSNSFSIPVAGNGAYVAGSGTWHIAGLYDIVIAATPANGFAAGYTYTLVVTWLMGGVPRSSVFSFGVV